MSGQAASVAARNRVIYFLIRSLAALGRKDVANLVGGGGSQVSRRLFLRTGGPDSYSKFSVFLKRKPTSRVESYKTTYERKAVVLRSVVEERADMPFNWGHFRV
jgi:hypothetical protein